MTEHKTRVGGNSYCPWKQYSRGSLEYSAKELGLKHKFIEELTDEELFDTILKVSCLQNANLSLKEDLV